MDLIVSHRSRGIPHRDPGLAGGQPARRLVRRRLRDDRGRAQAVQRGVAAQAVRGRLDLRHLARRSTAARASPRCRASCSSEEFARAKAPMRGRLLRRHPRRPDDPAVGDRGAEEGVPARDPERHDRVGARASREPNSGSDLASPEDDRRARRRRVGHQRPEGVDHAGPPRRLLLPAHPHRPRRAEAQGHLVPARADATSPASRCAASPSPTARPSSARCSSPTPVARRTTSWAGSTTAGRSRTPRSRSSAGMSATTGYRRFEEEYRLHASRPPTDERSDRRPDIRQRLDARTTRRSRSCGSTVCARCPRR